MKRKKIRKVIRILLVAEIFIVIALSICLIINGIVTLTTMYRQLNELEDNVQIVTVKRVEGNVVSKPESDNMVFTDTAVENTNSSIPLAETTSASILPDKYSEIPLDEDLKEYIYLCAIDNDIPPEILFSMAWKESSYNPDKVSKSNDHGLFQINICNFERLSRHYGYSYDDFCNRIYDPYVNTDCAIYILNEYRTNYTNDNWHHVLMRYNMGPSNTDKAFAQGIYSSQYSNDVINHAVDTFGLDNIVL